MLAEVAGTAGLAFSRHACEHAGDAGKAIAGPAGEATGTASETAESLLRRAMELAGKLRGLL
jgi:hypothetical protein